MAGASAIILEYGKRPPARWRRLLRWTVVAVLLATLAFAGLFALRNLAIWIARRHGYADVVAWYERARTTVVPAGTLLYHDVALHAGGPEPHTTETLEEPFPTLRQVGYDGRGVPMTFANGIIYAHEHDYWDVVIGKRPALVCVSYYALDAQARPRFFAYTYRLAGPGAKPMIPTLASSTSADGAAGRSLSRLRIFAGTPHPTDPTRFSLPFDCDGGRGRFEFQTDTDVTDGGKVAPDVRIEWDDAATQPGAADAVQR